MTPGVLLLWSGDRPSWGTFRIPFAGLVLGREMHDSHDDRISREHLRLMVADGRLQAEDLGSRNGSYVSGHHLVGPAIRYAMPAVIRTGRTVWVAVPDITFYENAIESRRGDLFVRASLREACRQLDAAAASKANVLLLGPRCVGRELARSYAEQRGGKLLWFDAPQTSLAKLLAERPDILGMELLPHLVPRDLETLGKTIGRLPIVTTARSRAWFDNLGRPISEGLAASSIELPRSRFDELPLTLAALVAELAPGANVHSTAIEVGLLRSMEVEEDLLLRSFADGVILWRRQGFATLRGEDIRGVEAMDFRQLVVFERQGDRERRERARKRERAERERGEARPAGRERASVDTATWATRRLCSDGSCVGVIAPSGFCKACGRPGATDGGPYR